MKPSTKAKNIIFDIGGVLFTYHNHRSFQLNPTLPRPALGVHMPLIEGINLLKKCHAAMDENGNRLHKLYILSNWNTVAFNQLTIDHPDVFSLFDGVVISGMFEDLKKPDIRIYNHLLKHYDLNPLDCIFIDDYPENIAAAELVGITGIEYKNHEDVERRLHLLEVISLK